MPRKNIKRRAEDSATGTKTKKRKKGKSPQGILSIVATEYPPQGDGLLTGGCGELRELVDRLLFDICMEIDSRYVDFRRGKKKKYGAARAPVIHRICKLQKFVKDTIESGQVILDDMEGNIEEGMTVRGKF